VAEGFLFKCKSLAAACRFKGAKAGLEETSQENDDEKGNV
jgi:hypothetical protein